MAQFLMQQATGGRIWAEIYALRELHYQKLMMLAHVVEHPFFNHSGRRATSPGRF